MNDHAPLILTLALDAPSFAFFDAQRRRFFPPERNILPAHLTLFHKLPPERLNAIVDHISAAAAEQVRFPLRVTGLRSLGRGVAYTLEAPPLMEFRRSLAMKWALWLTLQDRQRLQPHVTVQNKVDPQTARTLLATIQADFKPFTVMAEGVSLWRYLGGPWDAVQTFPFAAEKA
jgi:hypothetical protein